MSRCRCSGVIAAICVPMRSWPIAAPSRNDVGRLNRPRACRDRRGGSRGRRRRERLLDVARCIGVGRTESVQRVGDLLAQRAGPNRQQVARDGGVAAGQRDEQGRRAGANRHCAVIGDVESAVAGFSDPRLYRRLGRGDLVGAVPGGDGGDDEVAGRIIAGGRDAARVVPGGVCRRAGPEFVAAADLPHDGVDVCS